MTYNLNKFAEVTNNTIEELDSLGIPLTCEKGHNALMYTPTGSEEIMVECNTCNFNGVVYAEEKLRVLN